MTIEITKYEFEIMLLALGMALGIALEKKDKRLAKSLLETANAFGKQGPEWTPYEIPKDW